MSQFTNFKSFALAIMIVVGLFAEATTAKATGTETPTVVDGCFWCVEAGFESVRGVKDAVSGFFGWQDSTPNK